MMLAMNRRLALAAFAGAIISLSLMAVGYSFALLEARGKAARKGS
jgi:hypothetical protein